MASHNLFLGHRMQWPGYSDSTKIQQKRIGISLNIQIIARKPRAILK
jgi:hypothetical protein